MTRYYTTILALGKFSFGITDMSEGKAKRCTACFFILLMIDLLDLICDWLFFTDVYLIEKGLVFGPHEPALVWAVLALTIVGTVDFPLQVYVTSHETLNAKPKPHEEKRLNIFNLIILILEDIPQAVVLVLISLCREDPSSIWSLTKASFILLTSLIKFLPNITACCKKFSLVKTLILLGALMELSMGVMVFFFTQLELTETGGLQFNKPTTVVEDRFNDNLYLSDISLFIHDPNFLTKQSATTMPSNSTELNWIRIDYLRRIQISEQITVRLEYEKSGYYDDIVKLRVWEKGSGTSSKERWSVNGCYTISRKTGYVEIINPVYLSCSFSANKSSSLYLTLNYIEPEGIFKKHIMGNIVFNARYQKPGGQPKLINKNLSPAIFSNSIRIEDFKYEQKSFDGTQIKTPILLHYFRHQSIVKDAKTTGHVLFTSKDGKIKGRLYHNKKNNLIDVEDIWKTGWRRCPTTGNLGPQFDANVNVVT